MTVTAVSSVCRVQVRPDPRGLPPLLESMRIQEDHLKILCQPQMKVCNPLTTMATFCHRFDVYLTHLSLLLCVTRSEANHNDDVPASTEASWSYRPGVSQCEQE